MDAFFPRIGIVGSGAVGGYFGARLALGGADVRFLMRGDLAAVRARGSMVIRDESRATEVRPVAAFGSAAEIGAVDLAIVALKTTSGGDLPGLLGPLLGPATAVLTLQNGLGADELLAGLFGAERIIGGLVFMALNRTGPGELRCFHPGSVSIGEFGRPPMARTRNLAAQIEAAGMRTHVVEDLLEARWRKLVWNIPFNGLSIAEGGVATDRICAEPGLAAEARELMREVQRAAAAFGYRISDDYLKRQFDVTPPMGSYRPSSLVDFLAGRDVEVETIWGEPLRRARAAGVEMPRLGVLYSRLNALCSRPRAPDA
ncbi:MAG: 2-dehydropantoate 2-reductase [Opitutaceae bacterium]|jgi:2-dehydropantoate 2-reductase